MHAVYLLLHQILIMLSINNITMSYLSKNYV